MKKVKPIDEERVVLLDEAGAPTGVASKYDVHTDHTPLHLAFSCYLFNDSGEVLITRRALGKRTWPGVWTNSFCGHPSPGEPIEVAIICRGREELGAEISGLEVVLPEFRYRATDAGGVVENEVCPVYIARVAEPIRANADEIAEWAWVSLDDLAGALERTPFVFSPWMTLQLPQLLTQSTKHFGARR